MKFLSLCTYKDSISMLPLATIRKLTETSLDWTNQQKQAGKILEIYSLPGAKTMVISEYATAEDLNQALASIPAAAFMNFEVYPMGDFNTELKTEIELLKAAEKMFPAREMAGVR